MRRIGWALQAPDFLCVESQNFGTFILDEVCPRSVQELASQDARLSVLDEAQRRQPYMQGLDHRPYLRPLSEPYIFCFRAG